MSYQESQNQAVYLKAIQTNLLAMDVEYLESALKVMEENTSWQESAMILNPDPHTAIGKVDLNRAKNRQLRLYVEAAKNLTNIMEAEMKLQQARTNSNRLEDLFR